MSEPVAAVAHEFRAAAAAHRRCFWLDGGGAREWSGRRSMIGWLDEDDVSLTYDAARREVVRHRSGRSEVVGDDVFEVLEREVAETGPAYHWVGYLGYACRPDLPALTGGDVPDAVWMRTSTVGFFEHAVGGVGDGGFEDGGFEARARGALAPQPPLGLAPQPPSDAGPPDVPDDYAAAFAEVQRQLRAGNTYEVNLTYRTTTRSDLDPVTTYLRLRDINPAPYAGFLQHDLPGARAWLLSSSPERFALVDRERVVETRPIKGTTPRGTTPEDDEAHRHRLATDPKFRAENLMIVDLLRNDLAQVCEPGTVEVPGLMEVESYPSVHQLVSTVRGRLRGDVSTVGALRAMFPAGSMTGAPKLRTMEVIAAVEATPRTAYAGAFGWLGPDGRADLGVVIRTLTTAGDGRYTLGTGGGITVRSDVADEHAESHWKAERLLAALRSR